MVSMFEITVRGTKGYGIDYGVCNSIECDSLVVSEEKLGDAVLYALKNFSTRWSDSLLSVRPYYAREDCNII